MEPGVHLIHNPVGPSSFQVLREELARHPGLSGRKARACHAGTLDPFAEGLLVILSGGATKLLDLIHTAPKRYVAKVAWGAETDTLDHLGKTTHEGDAQRATAEALDAALRSHLGWTDQVPPAHSAKKVGGEPAYKKAHRGESVSLPPCRVYLHQARFVEHDLPRSSTLELLCRGGFYVRSLARDLGRAMGCFAHLAALHRSHIGPWVDPGPGAVQSIQGPDALPWAKRRELSDADVGELRAGHPIQRGSLLAAPWRVPEGFPDPNAPVLGLHRARAIFLLDPEGEGLRVRTLLPGGV
jgi:tRNA pseudouridine55 synthase